MKLSALPSLIGKLYAWLERFDISYTQSLSLIATAIFLRTFAENFTNSTNEGTMSGFLDTFFHYPIWFGCLFMTVILIFSVVGRMPVPAARTIISLASFGILIPPAIDILTHGFASQPYNFIIGGLDVLLFHFSTLLMFSESVGLGIKVEIVIALIAAFVSIGYRTKSVFRGVLASFLLYSAIFLFGSLPMIGIALNNALTPGEVAAPTESYAFGFYMAIDPARSDLWPRPIMTDRRDSSSPLGTASLDHFSISMTALLLPIFIALMALLYARSAPEKWRYILGNLRYTRLLLYLMLAGFGTYLGFSWQGSPGPQSLGDALALLMLGVSVVFSCLFLIWENDENDEAIDKVSNASRPLVAGHFTEREWGELKWTFLAIALVSALLAGWYTFIFILFFILLYHAYSCPPLRLKRVPGVSTILIAGNAVVTVMTGFYLGARTEDLSAFPLEAGIGIFIVFLLAENIKNLKDIRGDKAGGILTLPVLLGEHRAPYVVAALAALATLSVPLLFGISMYSLLLALTFILPICYFLVRKPYSELPVFALYLAYFIAFFLLTITGLA